MTKVKGRARKAGRKRKNPVAIPQMWDHGATGMANRVGLVIETRGDIDPATGEVISPNGVTGARRYDMLEVYAKRGWISTRGHTAGELYRMAWLRTEIGTCPPWLRERVDSSPKPDEAINVQIDCMSALIKIGRMIHHDDRRIVDCVCGSGDPIGRLPEYRGRRHEDGKAHLRKALETLADHVEGLARKSKSCH